MTTFLLSPAATVYVGQLDGCDPFLEGMTDAEIDLVPLPEPLTAPLLAVCHANIGPEDTRAGRLLRLTTEAMNAVPNFTSRRPEVTSDEFMHLAVDRGLLQPCFC